MDSPRQLLPRCRPEDVGVDPGGILGFLHAQRDADLETHAMVLVRHGKVFAEGYWHPYTPADRPLVYSLSKSFTSAAVGLAVADGVLSYDDRLVDLFADVADPTRVGPRAATIRVRDCLAMATGHTADTVFTPHLAEKKGRTPWAGALCPEPAGVPGETFCYNQWATWTLAEVVRRATGQDVHALLRHRVLLPLGITESSWDADRAGRVLGFSGFHLAPESLAAFFQLLLAGGVHNGQQLLPAAWVAGHARLHTATVPAGTRAPADTPDWGAGYGWQFWRNARGGYRGDGAYGQFGVVLPEHDLVVVLTGHTDRMQAVLDNVFGHLLPAIGREVTADADRVAAELRELRLRPVPGQRGALVHLTFENRRNRWRLDDDAEGWLLRWVDSAGGDNTVAVGHGAWRRGVMRWHGRELAVAASGAWVSWGRFLARIVALDSPHWIEVDLRDDGSGRTSWPFQPLHTDELAGLAQVSL